MKRKMTTKISMLALALMAFSGSSSAASTATANFQASASLNASCTHSVNNINLGNFTPASTGEISNEITINITCSKGLSYYLYASAGGSGDYLNKTMSGTAGNTDKLKYNVYGSDGVTIMKTQSGDPSGTIIGSTGNGLSQSRSMTLRVPLNQYIKPDTYSDNLSIILEY